MSQGGISDKSRRFSLLALQELEKIVSKVPDSNSLSEENISWLNERMRCFYENVKQTRYKRFSFLPACKRVRDSLAHSTSDRDYTSLLSDWNDFYRILPQAQSELEQNIKRSFSQNNEIRAFEKNNSSFGTEIERKTLVQSLCVAFDTSLEQGEKFSFQNTPMAQEVKKFLDCDTEEERELQLFAMEHSKLNQQIQEEIISIVDNALKETALKQEDCPFYDENILIQKIQKLSSQQIIKNFQTIEQQLLAAPTGKDNSCDLNFYQNKFQELMVKSKKEKIDSQQAEILARNLKSDLQKSLQERFFSWQLEEIDKRRKAYLKELYEKLQQFKKLEDLLHPFTKDFGRLWDMSNGNFDDYGFEILKDFADLLEQDQSLQELADLLGRQATEVARYEKELRDKVEVRTEFHPKPAFRGQISGLRLSGEISSALPSELALYNNPQTRLYFSKKFIEKHLLSYSYTRLYGMKKEEHTTEEVEIAIEEGKGPVIICVDTSGSMQGVPERVAKTITFALTKKCLEEERNCYLISFSTGIEVQDMSLLKTNDGLQEMIKFLRKSFNGGTDAEPALHHAVDLILNKGWKRADLLLVSDFVMGALSEEIVTSIKKCQEDKTKFFSLVIGDSGNQNTIAAFDENWVYDSSARGAMRHLVRQLSAI